MSLPRILGKVIVTGTAIFGKALAEAGRQAVRNARHKPDAVAASAGAGAAGGAAGAKNPSMALTQQLKMTVEEAHMILNVKKGEPMEVVEQHYEHIFKANGPPPPPPADAKPPPPTRGRGASTKPFAGSHYLQSKVFRALERLKAEKTMLEEVEAAKLLEKEAGEGAAKAGEAVKEAGEEAGKKST